MDEDLEDDNDILNLKVSKFNINLIKAYSKLSTAKLLDVIKTILRKSFLLLLGGKVICQNALILLLYFKFS